MSTITILSESKKGAVLITDGKMVAWVMSKMRRTDGTFTPGAFKALAEGITMEQHKAKQAAYDNPNQPVIAYRETEKAIGVQAISTYYCHAREEDVDIRELIWIPKSMVINGEAPKWFVKKKLADLTYQDGSGYHYFELM